MWKIEFQDSTRELQNETVERRTREEGWWLVFLSRKMLASGGDLGFIGTHLGRYWYHQDSFSIDTVHGKDEPIFDLRTRPFRAANS